MKYVKTFENFAQELDSENVPNELNINIDMNSPEVKKALANLAEEEGLDPEEVIDTAVQVSEEPHKHNEEEEPFTIATLLTIIFGVTGMFGGCFGLMKLSQNASLKRYVKFKAEEEAKAAIQKDPSLINKGYEEMIRTIYDKMMSDKEFIEKCKQLGGGFPSRTVQGLDGTRYRGFSPTAGQL
jgi:hypothetical protein